MGIFTPFPLVFFINGLLRKKQSFERISLVPKYGTYPALDLLFSDLASLDHGSAVTSLGKKLSIERISLVSKYGTYAALGTIDVVASQNTCLA